MGAETYRSTGANSAWTDRPDEGDTMRTDGDRAVDEMRSIGQLFSDLSQDMSTLLRQEVQLAQAETMQKVRAYGQAAGMIGAGGALAYAGLILVLIALAFLLAQWMEFWVAAGIVGVLTLIIGAILLMMGRTRIQETDFAPKQTINSVRETVNEVKETVR